MSADESQRRPPAFGPSPWSEYDIGNFFGVWCVVAEPGEWWEESVITLWRSSVTGRVQQNEESPPTEVSGLMAFVLGLDGPMIHPDESVEEFRERVGVR